MSTVLQPETRPLNPLSESKALFWLGCMVSDFLYLLPIMLASNPEHGLWVSYSVAAFFALIFATISLARTKDRTLAWVKVQQYDPVRNAHAIENNLGAYFAVMCFLAPIGFVIRTWLLIHLWHFVLYRHASLAGSLVQFWDTRTLVVGSIAAIILSFLKPKARVELFDGLLESIRRKLRGS